MAKRKGMPEVNELLICTTTKITPFAAWCSLDEYENLEGMVHISQVAGKWVRDIRKFVKPNKQYVLKVVSIDKERNLINLSLKRVSKQDERSKWNDYRKEQRAEKILEQVARGMDKTLEQTYEEVGFMLQEMFGDLFAAFEKIKKSPEILDKLDIDKKLRDVLISTVDKNFVEKVILLKAEIKLESHADDGIERIKKLLGELKEKSKAEIRYISAPKYRLEFKTKSPKQDEKSLRQYMDKMIEQGKKTDVKGSYEFIE
jgi:translation initiation factor 2 subunit 1